MVFSKGSVPHILQASDLSEVFCTLSQNIPPLKTTKVTFVEKLGCFGRWRRVHFLSNLVPLKRGIFLHTFPGIRFSGTYSPLDLGANGGASHPIRPPFRSTQQHLGSWRSGPDGFNFFFEGGWWWGSGVWTHKYLFEKALIRGFKMPILTRYFFGNFGRPREKDVLCWYCICFFLRSDVPPRWSHSWLLHLETYAPSVTRPWTYVMVKKAAADHLCFFASKKKVIPKGLIFLVG